MKHLEIIARGKVQGVFYRAFTKEKARELGINGYVKNQRDGSVLIRAEADEAVLEEFMKWCKQGSPNAVVSELETKELPSANYQEFSIKRF
jgi:acylphosphatase